MAKNDNLTDFLTDVANAIRTKKGTTNLINPQDFSSEIESIETGGGENKLPQVADKTVIEITSEDLNGATKIGNYLFQNCTALTSAVIPNSVTSIGSGAFQMCALTDIIIPSNVTEIKSNAFFGCSKMTTMTLLPTTPPTLASTSSIPSNVTKIEVPADSLTAYQTATNWSNFADKMVGV